MNITEDIKMRMTSQLFKNQIVPPVFKTLTKTMIEKGNPDCFKQLVSLARLFGVNFDDMKQGDRAEIPLVFTDGVESVIRFYVVHGSGGRKDKRYNIPAAVLREQASVGDTIAFTFKHDANGKAMLCVNVTRQPEYNYLTTSGGCVARAITEGK